MTVLTCLSYVKPDANYGGGLSPHRARSVLEALW